MEPVNHTASTETEEQRRARTAPAREARAKQQRHAKYERMAHELREAGYSVSPPLPDWTEATTVGLS